LVELLLHRGYEVHGLIRRASTFDTCHIEYVFQDPHDPNAQRFLHLMGTSAIWKRVWGNGEEQIAGQTVEDQRVMELQTEERKTEAAEEL